jgi:hypothetical protein
MSVTSSTSLSSPVAPLVSACSIAYISIVSPAPAEWFSAESLPPFISFDSVTSPLLSTIVAPSENATDLRGLRSGRSACMLLCQCIDLNRASLIAPVRVLRVR